MRHCKRYIIVYEMLLVRFTILGLLYGWKLNTEFFVLSRLLEMTELKSEILKQGNIPQSRVDAGTGPSFVPNNAIVYGA
jgi:hypothetical protein